MNNKLQDSIASYLQETLGLSPKFHDWQGLPTLPFLLSEGYSFFEMELLGQRFLAFCETNDGRTSPSAMAKHLNLLEERSGMRGVFVAEALEAFNRKRLIEHKVPFIVPGNQLYLPDLGIDFREQLRALKEKPPFLSSTAQLLLLAYLLKIPSITNWTATGLAQSLDSSKMTMSRAIDDLESHALVEALYNWREKQIRFTAEGKALWLKARPLLKTPVQKRIFLEDIGATQHGIIAGQEALSEKSMITPPDRYVLALTSKEWKNLQKFTTLRIVPRVFPQLAHFELEIWKYNPRLLGSNGMVDPLSLYLSMADDKDERIEAALEQLLETVRW